MNITLCYLTISKKSVLEKQRKFKYKKKDECPEKIVLLKYL